MIKLSSSQLRAARALLNWSRDELAVRSGISALTIHRYENNERHSSLRTSHKLFQTFETAGVEFLENDGVRFKSKTTQIFEGVEGFHKFFEFFYAHLEAYGGDACLNIYDESLLSKYRKNPEIHRGRMKAIIGSGKASLRILTTISDFIPYGYAQFRWQPQQKPVPTGFYVFGDCLALMSFVNPKAPYIVVIQYAPIAEGYRQTFNLAWKRGMNPPTKKGEMNA